MNKRIQKLYEQSWVEGSYQEPITNDDAGVFGNEQRYRTVKTSHFHHEHFAQLIVRECIDKISQEQDIAEQNWQCKNGVHICHELTKHFGVE